MGYVYATSNSQLGRRPEGENVDIVPNTYEEAMRLPQAAQWKATSDKEIKSSKVNAVYTLVPSITIPPRSENLGSAVGVQDEGWGQVQGVDCGSTFSPVCRVQSVRMVLAAAAEQHWEIWQLNVRTALLVNAPATGAR